jgi:hypothetical protein
MTRLFIYGSLLSPYIQLQIWGRTVRGHIAEVPGCYVDHSDEFPRLRSTPVFGTAALGRVIELNHDELSAAVEYEGGLYSLQTVVLSDLTEAVSFL